MKLLIRMKHGIGDNVQLGIVIKHLKHYHPDWFIGVEARRGLQSCFYGIADAVHILERPFTWHGDYEKMMHLPYPRPDTSYDLGVPSSKALKCLLEYFPECKPIEELFYYEMHPDAEAQERVSNFIEKELHGEPFAVIHYRGDSTPEDKNLDHLEAALLADACYDNGLHGVMIDFGGTCPFVDMPSERFHLIGRGHPLWPFHIKGLGDCGVMAELIRRAEVFHGIDSGPAFLANAVGTDAYCFWTNHHPVYCVDLDRGNVTHFVPWYIDNLLKPEGKPLAAKDYFEKHYQYLTYTHSLEAFLIDHYEKFSGGVPLDATVTPREQITDNPRLFDYEGNLIIEGE